MSVRSITLRSAAVLAAATIAALPLAGIASAAPAADRDCPDFSSQAEAQAALVPGDPERLDRDKDGIACEDYGYRSGSSSAPTTSSPSTASGTGSSSSGSSSSSAEPVQVVRVPSGSVDAGDGSATGGAGEDAAPLVLAAYGAVAASGAAVAVWRTRRSARTRG
jgi:hypothetical protein